LYRRHSSGRTIATLRRRGGRLAIGSDFYWERTAFGRIAGVYKRIGIGKLPACGVRTGESGGLAHAKAGKMRDYVDAALHREAKLAAVSMCAVTSLSSRASRVSRNQSSHGKAEFGQRDFVPSSAATTNGHPIQDRVAA
jgi:hypothetical protein